MAESSINKKSKCIISLDQNDIVLLGQNLCSCIAIRRRIRRRISLLKCYLISSLFLFLIFIYYDFQTSSEPTEVNIQSPRIMYVIRTSSKFYHIRLIYLLQTWTSFVHQHVYFVTDKIIPNISHNHLILTNTTCGNETHTMKTLCCKTAHDFILFHRHRNNYH
jgi:hypothetical protein